MSDGSPVVSEVIGTGGADGVVTGGTGGADGVVTGGTGGWRDGPGPGVVSGGTGGES
jgi:hypothetical protein